MAAYNEPKHLNGLALAYIGDAVYELAIRQHLLATGLAKPKALHQQAIQYVSAIAQARTVSQWMTSDLLTDTELSIVKRGRNASPHTQAKNASKEDYHLATGFEALLGYLYLTGETKRMNTLIEAAIHYIESVPCK